MRAARVMLCLLAGLCAGLAHGADKPAQQFAQLGKLKLDSGAVIDDCALGYRTVGTLNAARSNAVLIPTWHTGTSDDVLRLLGPKGLFDPSPWYVIVVDAIGNGVSCSPSNSTTQHGSAFPAFTVHDMVNAQYRLVTEQLRLEHLHAVVGYSMGALQTYQWMVSYPTSMDVAIPISGTPRLSSYDLLWWRTADMAIASDPAYAGGNYQRNPPLPLFWLNLTLNMNTAEHHNATTARADVDKLIKETINDPDAPDANNNLWQIRAILAHDIGELPAAAQRVKARVHIIQAEQDHLINKEPALAFAKLIKAGTTTLPGPCGHLAAITCDIAAVRTAVDAALAR